MPRLCNGFDGEGCVFSSSEPGKPAQPREGAQKCVFCDLPALEELEGRSWGQQNIIRRLAVPWRKIATLFFSAASHGPLMFFCQRLQAFLARDHGVFQTALARLGEVSADAEDYAQAAREFRDPEPMGRKRRKRPAAAAFGQ